MGPNVASLFDVFTSLARDPRRAPCSHADELRRSRRLRQLAHGDYGGFILESAERRWLLGALVALSARRVLVPSLPVMVCPVGGAHPEGAQPEVRSRRRALRANSGGVAHRGAAPLTGALVNSLGWGIIPNGEPTLALTAPKESDVPDATLVPTEVAAHRTRRGQVCLMAIAWNLNGSMRGVDGTMIAQIEPGRYDSPARLALSLRLCWGEWPGDTWRPSAHAARTLNPPFTPRQAGDYGR